MESTSDSLPIIDVPPPQHPPRGRKRGLRFSLLSLCALVAVACFAAAWYGVARRERAAVQRAEELAEIVNDQQEQIEKLRAELGHLTVTDSGKVHVVQLKTLDDHHWKWRVYLPPGRWKLGSAAGQIPRRGMENVSHGISTIDDGEFTLEAVLDRPTNGSPRFVAIHPSGKSSIGIAPHDLVRLSTNGASWTSLGANSQLEVRDADDQPVELLRLRTNKEIAREGDSRSFSSSDEPTFGLLIWIVQARPGE